MTLRAISWVQLEILKGDASNQTANKLTVFVLVFRMARVLIRAIYCLYQLTACAHRLHVKHAAKRKPGTWKPCSLCACRIVQSRAY